MSAEKGKKLFIKHCGHCHTIEKNDKHMFGPNLFGIMGKQSGTISGYTYSEANKNIGVVWNQENMNSLMISPKNFMPGSKMKVPEVKDKQERDHIIAYMKTFK